MNQERIGKFIAKCRKDKNLTQRELAEKLGVTDKTVSRWENGHYLPDISLYSDLCNLLDIEVTELLNGEKSEKIDKTEANKTIIDFIMKSISLMRRKVLLVSLLVIIITISVCLFVVRKNKLINTDDMLIQGTKLVTKNEAKYPVRYASIKKDDGWVCHFSLEYERDNLDTPYYYGYGCDNYKYESLDNFLTFVNDAYSDGEEYYYLVETNHPQYIYNDDYSNEIEEIYNYFYTHHFNEKIKLADLEDLNVSLIDKGELVLLFNKAIENELIEYYGNWPNISYPTYLIKSLQINNCTYFVGFSLANGYIMDFNIELMIGDDYLSDLISNNGATAEQKELFTKLQLIEEYVVKNQSFSLPLEYENDHNIYDLSRVFSHIEWMEENHTL